MNLIEGVLGHAEHANVGTELLNEIGNDVMCGGAGADAQTLGGHLLTGVLKVKAHHAVKLQLLSRKNKQKRYIYLQVLII